MPSDSSAAILELVARFRRQQPLRGGSLIVTIFGDSILPRGGAVALGSLIELAAPFGLKERLVRTAAARLAQEGWLEARRAGTLSEYRLSNTGRERFAEATHRIYSSPQTGWSGRWTVVVVPPMAAKRRKQVSAELLWRGFGALAANVFAHPEIDSSSVTAQRHSVDSLAGLIVFDADLTADDAPQRLIGLGWNLEDLGSRYLRFVKRFERVREALQAQRFDAQQSFLVRTLLIHEYRRLHLRDPLLPAGLLPADWPGAQAAALCRTIYSRVFKKSEEYLTASAVQLDGALPEADLSVMQRFGGLNSVG